MTAGSAERGGTMSFLLALLMWIGVTFAAATTKRVNRGRGHSYLLDGEKCEGVTTIISNGLPKPALTNWAAKAAAEYTADNLKTLNAITDRAGIIDLVKGAPWRDRDAAANRGTEVHKLAQRLAEGEEIEVPPELVGHVDAYLQFRDDWQPEDEVLEFTVINRRRRYMGTGDLIATIPALEQRLLIDLKTNRSGPFGEVALQLAAYRYGETYILDGDEIPMEPVDGCAVLWLRADGYDLVPVEAGPPQFQSFLYVQQVARFQTNSRDLIGAALTPPKAAA